MKIINTDFSGLLILEPTVHRDERIFLNLFGKDFFKTCYIDFKCLQSNQAMSTDKGVLRGLHFQLPPKPRPSWYG